MKSLRQPYLFLNPLPPIPVHAVRGGSIRIFLRYLPISIPGAFPMIEMPTQA